MGRFCAVANCGKIRSAQSCHRLPFHDPVRMKLWLTFLELDVNTPLETLRLADRRVCCLHFTENDFVHPANFVGRTKSPKRFRLNSKAIPTIHKLGVEELRNDNSSAGQEGDTVLLHQPYRQSVDEKSSSAQRIILNSQPVSSNRQKDVVGLCAVPTCCNRIEEWSTVTFHPLPFDDPETLKLWLVVLQQDVDTPIETLRTADLRVCGHHFSDDDYDRANKREIKTPVKYPALKRNKGWRTCLKKTAVPVAVPWCQQQCTEEGGVGEVTVNLDCLLGLFRTCGQCRGDCVTDMDGDRRRFTVVQRCQNCHHVSTWNSQPRNIYETVIQSGNSIHAKELSSLPCEVREEDQAWTGALRIVVKEEETDNDTNTAPSREQDPVGGGEEETNKAVKESEMNELQLEMSRDSNYSEEEVEEDDEEEEAMEEKEDEEREEENDEEMEELEEEEEDNDEWEMEEEEEVQKTKRGVSKEINFGKHGRVPNKLLGQRVLCPECGVLYSTTVHRCDPRKKFQCPDCDRFFVSESCLDAHRSTACKGKANYRCNFCLQPYHTMQEKQIHQKSHSRGELYLCSECPQTFLRQVERNTHLKEQHPKKYECPTCHKVFPLRSLLGRHMLSHSNSKPFKCQVCSRLFAQASQLKCHMRVHTGERPYQCRLCPKSFNHNVSLKNHIRRCHQGEIQHSPGSDNELA